MAEVKAGQLKKDIEAKKFVPLYTLHGEEPYYIDRLARLFEEHCLTEAEKGFNQHILYGNDTDHKTLLDTCMRYPMMAERQLVVLKEAQDMRDLEDIQPYIEKPAPTTVLVICYRGKKLDGRKKFAKRNGTWFTETIKASSHKLHQQAGHRTVSDQDPTVSKCLHYRSHPHRTSWV